MKKPLIIFTWCLLPIAFLIYHYGPGQKYLLLDAASQQVAKAQNLEKLGQYEEARECYLLAEKNLNNQLFRNEKNYLKLLAARTYLNDADVAEATIQIEALLKVALESPKGSFPQSLITDLRLSLARAEFYTAWHMRLEGAAQNDWLREVNTARQNYRLISENDQADALLQRNLEKSIYLQRIDLKTLKGLPLPDQNSGKGSSASRKMKDKRQSQSAKGEGEPRPGGKPKDSRGNKAGMMSRENRPGS